MVYLKCEGQRVKEWSQAHLSPSLDSLFKISSEWSAFLKFTDVSDWFIFHSNAFFFFFFSSFDSKFIYQQRGLGPIEEDTILVIDPNNAAVLQSSGKNLWVKLLDYLSFSKEVVLNPDWILESPGTLPKIRLRFSLGAGPGIKIVVWKLPRWF